MTDLLKLILGALASLFRSRAKLEAEILVLRQQIIVLRRRMPKRPDLNNTDRFLFVWLYHWFPSVLGAIAIVRPETIIRWLCVPKTPSVLIRGGNHLTSARHDRASTISPDLLWVRYSSRRAGLKPRTRRSDIS
jgi:hypothetical protein